MPHERPLASVSDDLRITAARAAREHPMLLDMLADGRLHLSGIARLVAHLTRENRDALLKRAAHRSKRQILELVAEIAPRADAPAILRKLPETNALPVSAHQLQLRPDRVGVGSLELCPDRAPSPPLAVAPLAVAPCAGGSRAVAAKVPPAVVEPLSPARYKVQFTASAAFCDKLERLRALMHSGLPGGDLAAIIEQAVTEKLERLEARRFARTSAPRKSLSETDTTPSSRHIPAAVRRAVRERDESRCRYVDERGRRCSARERLEYHHRHRYGFGGGHGLVNVCLMCPSHNRYLAAQDYGRHAMARYRRSGTRAPGAAAFPSNGGSVRSGLAPPRGT